MEPKEILERCASGGCPDPKLGRTMTTEYRGIGIVCQDCSHAYHVAFEAARAAENATAKARAAAYWRERGIEPGETVRFTGGSILPGGAFTWQGIARAGVSGPYVHIRRDKTRYRAECFHKVGGAHDVE